MSIPVTIDPLGTLGAELPYVQPLMTSPTTWSNTTGEGAASFGMTVWGLPNTITPDRRELAYKLFDGINTTRSYWPGYYTQPSNHWDAEIDFMGRQLKIISIETTGYLDDDNNNYIQIFAWNGEMNGDERVFVPVSVKLNQNGQKNLLVPVTIPAYYKAYRIRLSTSRARFVAIQEMQLNAVYRS